MARAQSAQKSAMPAPYWGDLPGPNTPARPGARSSSDHYASRPLQTQAMDPAPAVAPQPRSNRASVQTTNTNADTQTDSTLSPYASPVRSSFQGYALAPRPPSLPYGQSQYPTDVLEKRRRRASKNKQEDREYSHSDPRASAPPPAPDVPRASSLSYRHPYGNGGLPYTHTKAAEEPDLPLSPGIMGPDNYQLASADPSKQPLAAVGSSSDRRASSDSAAAKRNSITRESVNGHRKASLGNEVDRRMMANARSPLQKLELTLDNITKEEKRARVAAAEQRARTRTSRGSGDLERQHAVRFKDGEAETEPEFARPQVLPDPVSAQPGIAPQGAAKVRPKQHASQAGNTTATKATATRFARDTGVPQRNMSFRERAARDEINLPSSTHRSDSPTTSPTSGYSLARSASNKLKKDPPGDAAYRRWGEGERRTGIVSQRGATQHPGEGLGLAAVPAPTGSTPPNKTAGRSMRTKAPPLDTAMEPRRSSGRTDVDHPDSPFTPGKAASTPGKRGDPASITFADDLLQDRAPATATSIGGTARTAAAGASATAAARGHRQDGQASDDDLSSNDEHRFGEYFHRREYKPGQGMYNPPKVLGEWKKGTVGTLSGTMLDLEDETTPKVDHSQTWWENPPTQRRGSISTRPRKAEAFDGEYDETNGMPTPAPTRFKPPLFLKCGPLLRYCGIRTDRISNRSAHSGPDREREFWRGTVMIVTQDQDSSYDIAPTLRLFVQPIELLPPPPSEVRGETPPEFVDPIAGHPKLGRKGETLYVRPVDHLDESKDHSQDETDRGLFEKTRSPPYVTPADGSTDAPGSFAARRKRTPVDGEKVGKYKDVRGYRLHAERGYTFWRFSVEVELREKEQRIAYRINRGPATGFWVPAKNQSMNIMFHSCNGFSVSVDPNDLSGPDPLWRDVLNNHQSRPFHVMIGGGDQLYCDSVMRKTELFQEWLMIRNPLHKHNAPFTPGMQDELEEFYLERYSMWFSQGLFGLANSQIPMVNMYDDHDIIDGFGSYPHHFMSSPVFSGLGNVAFKYYMLFQHQSIVDETEETEPSWAMGVRPGPYIQEQSRSLFLRLGAKIALLAVDCRTERMRDQVVREDTWDKLMDRCYSEIVKGKTEHLLVLLGVPIAYPRLVWLENILTSRLLDPIKALGKTGLFSNVFNKFDGGVEVLDDLDDHWTAKNHKDERKTIIEDLQDLAADRSVRITILGGDVHLAAIGQFYSNPKLELAKHKDFRYMPNVISSAIVNTPPPDLMADVLNKRNKVHHLDKDTDEDMIPMFAHGVEGKPRNNKRLLPHRNWCSIREYTPGQTPPSTPPEYVNEAESPAEPIARRDTGLSNKGVTRRLSKKSRGPAHRADVIDSRPPISGSGGGGIFRSLSSRGRRSTPDVPAENKRPVTKKRTLSLTRGDFGGIFRRRSESRNRSQPDDGGINGTWGESDLEAASRDRDRDRDGDQGDGGYDFDYEDNTYDQRNRGHGFLGSIGLRGGGGPGGGGSYDEFSDGDDSYFTTRAPQNTRAGQPGVNKAARVLGTEALNASRRYGNQHQPRQQQVVQPQFGVTTKISGPGQDADEDEDEDKDEGFQPSPFQRTPTGLSAKQVRKRAKSFDVNIEGGLDICLNVEVSARDPAGITVPYRLLVPRLWYDASDGDEVEMPERGRGKSRDEPSGPIKRFFSLSRARGASVKRGGSAQPSRQRREAGDEHAIVAPGTAI
ncbi:hypothetical protein KVR01_006850 [Diaporthe batatas]|uniref:uncharacterized protein n=1 Tax=Diaporthe batatas TaxID=748121 RepID=UPI001D0500F3|nr:uncharacterized protein KVR01_006850 [Diaporthe batatas]KAG8163553.1 hypothetical protein KVR01_006850 [Diaporthe batatas]